MGLDEITVESDRELVVTRLFDAPRARLFRMWVEPEQLAQWWGPEGFTTTVEALDARPGGEIRIAMWSPDGAEYPLTGAFYEVVEPERLVYSIRMTLDGEVSQSVATVVFEDLGGRTRLRIRNRFVSLGGRTLAEWGVAEGWASSLARIAAALARDQDLKQART